MGLLVQDVRHAARRLSKTPGFTLTTILTLALGVGATRSIFSMVEGLVLRPLPFRDPGRLVLIKEKVNKLADRISLPARIQTARLTAPVSNAPCGPRARPRPYAAGG